MSPRKIAGALSATLLSGATGLRCGLLKPVQDVASEPCDLSGIFNATIPADGVNAWQSASGAVAYTRDDAVMGAIGEGLERYAAANALTTLRTRASLAHEALLDHDAFALFDEDQWRAPGFPFSATRTDHDLFACVYSLLDNRPTWVPQELVQLGPRVRAARIPSSSTGLAAHRDAHDGPWLALLRAAQELVERDALAATWLNGLGGRQLPLDAARAQQVAALGGEVFVFDLTQTFSPHAVIAVAGGIPHEGRMRYCLGAACRASTTEALDKAWLEWAQSITFAGYHLRNRTLGEKLEAHELRRFDQHALFYTANPQLWHQTALIRHRQPTHIVERETPPGTARADLQQLVHALAEAQIALLYRELTTVDVAQAGLRVMRVLSPQLSTLHADERAPQLGGRCRDVTWRYPEARSHTPFPNPLPHPLG